MSRGNGGSTPASRLQQTQQLAEEALDQLASQLASGNSRQLTAFLTAMGRFHSYSFQNLMLILSQRPDATRVAGFQTWKTLGRAVRKGEKGIAIIAPMRIRTTDESADASAKDSGRDSSEERSMLRFRVVHVFDIAQTDGDPLPDLARVSGDPGEALHRLEHAIRARGITLSVAEHLDGADGVSKGGEIAVIASLGPAERFSVLVHEMAHELLHHAGETDRPSKTVRETEAEAVAFAVCEAVGIATNGAAADYIRLYRGDADTLAGSLDRIRSAVSTIMAMLEQDRVKLAPEHPSEVVPEAVSVAPAAIHAHTRSGRV